MRSPSAQYHSSDMAGDTAASCTDAMDPSAATAPLVSLGTLTQSPGNQVVAQHPASSFFVLPIELIRTIFEFYMAAILGEQFPERQYPVQLPKQVGFDEEREILIDLRHLRVDLAMDTPSRFLPEYATRKGHVLHKSTIHHTHATFEQLLRDICALYKFPVIAQRIEVRLDFNNTPTVNEVNLKPLKRFFERFDDLRQAKVEWYPNTFTFIPEPGTAPEPSQSFYIKTWTTKILRAQPRLIYMRLNNIPHQTITPTDGVILPDTDERLRNHRQSITAFWEHRTRRTQNRIQAARQAAQQGPQKSAQYAPQQAAQNIAQGEAAQRKAAKEKAAT
jgi:hypothetical protein